MPLIDENFLKISLSSLACFKIWGQSNQYETKTRAYNHGNQFNSATKPITEIQHHQFIITLRLPQQPQGVSKLLTLSSSWQMRHSAV